MNGKQKIGAVVVVIGIGLVVAGVLLNMYQAQVIEAGFKDAAVMDSKTHPQYQLWAAEGTSNVKYYVWNVTNHEAVMAGAQAQVEQVGPYVYSNTGKKFDNAFVDNGAKVEWNSHALASFNAVASGSLSESDVVYTLSPAYLATLGTVGSETNLLVAMIGPTFKTLIGQLETAFMPGFYIGASATTLNTTMNTFESNFLYFVQAGVVYVPYVPVLGVTTNVTLFEQNNATESVKADIYFNDVNYNKTLAAGRFLLGPNSQTVPALRPGHISLDSQKKLLFGVPAAGLPGWLAKAGGAGLAEFLATATQNKTLVAAGYGVTQGQLDLLLAYVQTHVLGHAEPLVGGPGAIAKLQHDAWLAQWANATYVTTGLDGNGDSQADGVEVGYPTASGIQSPEALLMWDGQSPGALNTLNGFGLWYGAAKGDPTLRATVDTLFPNLTPSQVNAMYTWVIRWRELVIPIGARAAYGASNDQDMAYVQWGSAALLGGKSFKGSLPPQQQALLPGTPEFGAWSLATNMNVTLNHTEARALLNGTRGLFDSVNVGMFLGLAATAQFSTIEALFGLNQAQATVFAGYVQSEMLNKFSRLTVQGTIAQGSGLVVRRTIRELLYDFEDPLLKLLLPAAAQTGFSASGNLTEAQARAKYNVSTAFTGKTDITKVQMIEKFRGDATLTKAYPSTVTPEGHVGIQFEPLITTPTRVAAVKKMWLSPVLRPLPLKYAKEMMLGNLKLLKHTIDASFWADVSTEPANAAYGQYEAGLLNVTTMLQGVPVFFSQVAMHGVRSNVSGVVSGQKYDAAKHESYVALEPMTGNALSASVRLQTNVQVRPGLTNEFYPNVRPGMYPLFWLESGGEATPEIANSLATLLANVDLILTLILYGGIGLGALLVIIGAVVIFKNQSEGHDTSKVYVEGAETATLNKET